MSMLVSFVLSFFPRDVLDEILNLIGSVSEGFPSYSYLRPLIYLFVTSCLRGAELLKTTTVTTPALLKRDK